MADTKDGSVSPPQPADKDGKTRDNEDIVDLRDLVDLPLARVKRIMKADGDVKLISQEAVILVTKATELMIEHLAKEAHKNSNGSQRKTIQYQDLASAVDALEEFDFLQDIIPSKPKEQNQLPITTNTPAANSKSAKQ